MSVSSGSDVTIPMQDSPPPPPSPYANQKMGKAGTPEPRQEMVTISGSSGVENVGFQAEATGLNTGKTANGDKKRTQTEIPMSDYSSTVPVGPHVNEAVNSELVNMNVLDTIPHKPQSEFGPYENLDDYFISVNQHKKFLRRGEKLYVTKDKRKSSTWKKYVCWLVVAVVLAGLVTGAILAAVGYIPFKTEAGSYSMVGMTTSTSFPEDSVWTEAGDFGSSSSTTPPSTTDETQDQFSSSTEFAIPVSNIYVPYAAELQLIMDSDYSSELSNPNSTEFQTLATTVQEEVKELLKTDAEVGIAYARITSFSSGSIIVKLKIGWTDADEPKEYADIQRVVSRWKQIGSYQLLPGTTTLYHLYDFCKVSNGGCSDYCTFEYDFLDFMCTCPESKLLGEDKKTCQEMPLPPAPTPETSSESEQDLSSPTSEEPQEPPASSETIPELHFPSTSTTTVPPTTSTTTTTTPTTTTPTTTTPTTTTPTTTTPTTTTPTTTTPTTTSTTTTTTTTTTEAPEPLPVDTSSESSQDDTSRSLEPVETTAAPEVEPEASSTSAPHIPVEEEADPVQVYPHPEIDQPLPATPATTTPTTTTTTTTTELPAVRALEYEEHEAVPLPVEPEIPVETTPSPVDTPVEPELPVSVTTTTTTTTTTTVAPLVAQTHEAVSNEDTAHGSYEDGSSAANSQSLESETIMAATTTAATTTTSSTTTTTPAPVHHLSSSDEQVDSRSIEAVSEEVLPVQPVSNVTSQSRVNAGRADPAFLGDSSMEQETETPSTTRPLLIPSRPQSQSDEFMAFSDANMKEINARLMNKTSTTTSPETQQVETGSYENNSGAVEFENISGSHSEEGGGSGEDRRSGSLLQSPPEVIPINNIDVILTSTTTTPVTSAEVSRERESLESHDPKEDTIPASQEREIEETTFTPGSLQNDTAVNDLTPGITEDSINTESVDVDQKQPEVVEEVVQVPDRPSFSEPETETEKPTPSPSPVPEVPVPAEPQVPAPVPKSEESVAESHEHEQIPTTTTTTLAPAVQVPVNATATGTRAESAEVNSASQESSQVHSNEESKAESSAGHDTADKDNELS